MSKSGIGILLIILGFVALWLYNTGRAAAVLAIFKAPAPVGPATVTTTGLSVKPIAGGTTGTSTIGGVGQTAACASLAASGAVTPQCAAMFWQELQNPGQAITQGVDAITGQFGVKLF